MIYSYDGINFEIEHVIVTPTPVYDDSGTDYLYTMFRIEVESVWNPKATRDTSIVAHDPPASESLTTLGARLRQPRKVLSVSYPNHNASVNGGAAVPIIQSPAAPGFSGTDGRTINVDRYLTDAKNGPVPIETQVTIVGEKTAHVRHVVETWLVECNDQRPFVSNRWSMRKQRDADYWETRIIDGTAIFRSDMLYQQTRDADGNLQRRLHPQQFAHQFIPPCPYGFKRVGPDFFQHEDGVTFDYHVEDVQQPLAFLPEFQAVISRVEGEYIEDRTAATFPMATMNKVSESMQDYAKLKGSTEKFFGYLPAVLTDVQNVFPTRIITLNLTAYGTPLATKNDLLAALLKVATGYRVRTAAGGQSIISACSNHFLQDIRCAIDLWNRKVTLSISLRMPGAVGTLLRVTGIIDAAGALSGVLDPALEEAGPIATRGQLTISPASVPPQRNQTQGNIPTPAESPPPNSPCVTPVDPGPINSAEARNDPTYGPPRSQT